LILAFAGPDEGGVQSALEQTASKRDIRSQVRFAGPLFAEAKWAAYRDSDVFVLPSQNENFGNTAAEAVASGTPVIVTERCGIAPLLAGEAGLVVAHEESALCEALWRVLGDAELRGRLKVGCARVASRLGWEEPVRETERLYARLATGQAQRAESQRVE
jgi:glycosyltransferase involved in cell wall biosynthesis